MEEERKPLAVIQLEEALLSLQQNPSACFSKIDGSLMEVGLESTFPDMCVYIIYEKEGNYAKKETSFLYPKSQSQPFREDAWN